MPCLLAGVWHDDARDNASRSAPPCECGCPAACNVTTYNADLSYAALSVDGMDALLADGRAAIHRKYTAARGLRERVTPAAMLATLQRIMHVQHAITAFSQFWTSRIERVQTALSYRLEAAIGMSISMVNEDVTRLYGNVSAYQQHYYRRLSTGRQWIGARVQALSAALLNVAFHAAASTTCNFQTLDIFQETVDIREEIGTLYEVEYGEIFNFGRDSNPDFFCPTYATVGKKNDARCKEIETLTSNMFEFLHEADCGAFDEAYVESTNATRGVLECLFEYEHYLSSTGAWMAHSNLTYVPR